MRQPILTTRIERAMAEDEEWCTILNNILVDMREKGIIGDKLVSEFSQAVSKYKKYLKNIFKLHGYEVYKEQREQVYKKFYSFQEQLSLLQLPIVTAAN
jgi:hypothetical protein